MDLGGDLETLEAELNVHFIMLCLGMASIDSCVGLYGGQGVALTKMGRQVWSDCVILVSLLSVLRAGPKLKEIHLLLSGVLELKAGSTHPLPTGL